MLGKTMVSGAKAEVRRESDEFIVSVRCQLDTLVRFQRQLKKCTCGTYGTNTPEDISLVKERGVDESAA